MTEYDHVEDLYNMCRLCLSTSSLVSIFDRRLESEGNMQQIVEITTGVKISRNDEISHMLCSKCCHLTIRMFKFRNTSMLNDMELKEKAAKRRNMHRSVQDLFKQDPKLTIPPSVYRCDISPVIVVTKSKTDNLQNRMRHMKRKKTLNQKEENDSKKFRLAEDQIPSSVDPTIEQSQTHLQDEVSSSAIKQPQASCNVGKLKSDIERKQEQEELPLFSIKTVTKSFICDICNKVNYSTRELKKHKTTHMHCALCRSSFESMEDTKQHETCCSIKKIMNNLPRLYIKRCDEIEELREKYSNAFRNFLIVEISDDENEPILNEQTRNVIEQSKSRIDNIAVSKISDDGVEESGNDKIISNSPNCNNLSLHLRKVEKISMPEGNGSLGKFKECNSDRPENICNSPPSKTTAELILSIEDLVEKSVIFFSGENNEIFNSEKSNPQKCIANETLKTPVKTCSAKGSEKISNLISPEKHDGTVESVLSIRDIFSLGERYLEDDVGEITEKVPDASETSYQKSNPASEQQVNSDILNFKEPEIIKESHILEGESKAKSHVDHSKTISDFVSAFEKPKEIKSPETNENCEVISLLEESEPEPEIYDELPKEFDKSEKLATKSDEIGSETILILHSSYNVLDIENHTDKSNVTDNSKNCKEPSNPEKKIFPANSKEMSNVGKSKNRNLKRNKSDKSTLPKCSKKLKTCNSLDENISTQQSLNNNKQNELIMENTNKRPANDNSFIPNITFDEENILEVKDLDDENAYLNNLLNSIKKSKMRQAVQTNSPSNSDISSIKKDEFLYELKNLRGDLTFSQIPVSISYSKTPSIKYTFEPSSLMKNQKKLKNSTNKKSIASVEKECNIIVYIKQKEQVSEVSESEPNIKKREDDTLNVPIQSGSFESTMQIECATSVTSSTIEEINKNDQSVVENTVFSLDKADQSQTIEKAKSVEISLDLSNMTSNNNSIQSDDTARNEQIRHIRQKFANVYNKPSTTATNCSPGNMTNLSNIISPQMMNMGNPILSNTFLSYTMNNMTLQNTMNAQPQFYLVKNSNPNGIVSAPMTMITTTPLVPSNTEAFCTSNTLAHENHNSPLNMSSPNISYTQSSPVLSSNSKEFRSNNVPTNSILKNMPTPNPRFTLMPPPMRKIRCKPPPPMNSAMQMHPPSTSEAQKIVTTEKRVSKAQTKSQNLRTHVISHTPAMPHAIHNNPSEQVFVAPQAPPKNRMHSALPTIRIVQRKVANQNSKATHAIVTENHSICDKLEGNNEKDETSNEHNNLEHSASSSAKYIRVKNLADLK